MLSYPYGIPSEQKLNTILGIVSGLAADNTPAPPDLPDDIQLPISTPEDLATVEEAIVHNPTVKQALVRIILI